MNEVSKNIHEGCPGRVRTAFLIAYSLRERLACEERRIIGVGDHRSWRAETHNPAAG